MREHACPPCLNIRIISEINTLIIIGSCPWKNRDICNCHLIANDIIILCKPTLQNTIQTIGLIGIALHAISNFLFGINIEVMRLPKHRAEAAHLPHEPFCHFNLATHVLRHKVPCFLCQILQNSTRFKDTDRRAIWPVMVNNGRHPVIGRESKEVWLKLVALPNIHRDDIIGEA